jgi:hypothetical protein
VFRDFLTKSFFRLVAILAFASFAALFFFAVVLEKHTNKVLDAERPLAESFGKPVLKGQAATASSKTNVSIQHLSGREVGRRLNEIVADVFSFNRGDYAYNTSQVEKYFTPEGYAQYQQFLSNSSFQETLQQQNLQSAAFAEQEPLELSSGVYNGAYKWLFEVPVTISFIPKDTQTYRDNPVQPQNRRVTLRVQFTRVNNDPQDPEAVKIEIWQILPARKA